MKRLPRPSHRSPIEAFSGKQWDMSKLQLFGCMCYYHIPKAMRGISAGLKPTSTTGIFMGYFITSHKYVVFIPVTGATVGCSRDYFNPDEFPIDSGGAIVQTSSGCLHLDESSTNTTSGRREITTLCDSLITATPTDSYDTQIHNATEESKQQRTCDMNRKHAEAQKEWSHSRPSTYQEVQLLKLHLPRERR